MGYSRRKEARENVEQIDEANRRITGITLGQVCAAGIVTLNMACYGCRRRGRYKVTGLIDRYGANMMLTDLKALLTKDCPRAGSGNYFNRCGCYFPGPLS